jgi:AcrR family transcriptional regulator
VTQVASPHPEGDDRSARMRVQRRTQIVEAAKQVFAERGYHNASINDIISRAEIARGTFYLYFSNKHKVFESILAEALEDLRSRITVIGLAPQDAPPQLQLRQNLVRLFEYVLGQPLLTQILLSQGQYPEAELAERVREFYDHVTDLIRSSLEHGIRLGLVRPCDTLLIAAALLGAVRGMVGHVLSANETASVEQIVDEFIVFALRGVIEPGGWTRTRT